MTDDFAYVDRPDDYCRLRDELNAFYFAVEDE
jgi:hypothetical protein